MNKGAIQEKSFGFAVRAVEGTKFLQQEKKECVISKQLLRNGTAVGALVREAEHAESRPDFAHKINIALKEANETIYWLELHHQTEYLSEESFNSLYSDAIELVKLLASIVYVSPSLEGVRSRLT